MSLNIKYTEDQIEKIGQEGFIYTCACPSKVSEHVGNLRQLFEYQAQCLGDTSDTPSETKTHQIIMAATQKAHEIMEQCLHDVLIHEGWDLETFTMPEHLRQKLDSSI